MDEQTELPLEIFDKIVENVSKDRRILMNCALASRALLSSSRRHLFASICLDDHKRCDGLYVLLTESSTLSTYIHNLTILIYRTQLSPKPGWLSMNTMLPGVLDMLTSLRSCSLYIFNGNEWKDIDPQITAALFQTFTLPSLSSIDIIGLYGIPNTFFNIPATVERLKLKSVSFERVLDTVDHPTCSLSFKSLDFDPGVRGPHIAQSHKIISAIAANPDSCFSRVADLRVYVSRENFPIFRPILNAAARSLTSLELDHVYGNLAASGGRPLDAFQFNLANFMNITRLSFSISMYYITSSDLQSTIFTSSQDLITILASSASTLARIETLTIMFIPKDLHSSYDISMAKYFSHVDVWGQLDETICRQGSTMELRVDVILRMPMYKLVQLIETKKEWQEAMRGKFPTLEKRGALTLNAESSLPGFDGEYQT